ncbi:MAG: outer membrane lipoprotein carrier protein LolA [bacterium]
MKAIMKLLPATALALTLCAEIHAADKADVEPASKVKRETAVPAAAPETEPVGKSTASALSVTTSDRADAILDRLKKWDRNLESLKAEFRQKVLFLDAGLEQSLEGRIHFLKPNRLRVEHVRPSRQIIYTDKKILWIYKPEDSQAVRAVWEDWQKNQSTSFAGIMDFGNYASIVQKHDVTVSSLSAGGYLHLKFIPRGNPSLYTLELFLSPADCFPAETKLTVGRTVISTVLANIEKNGKIPAEIFEFKPPKGTNILKLGGPNAENR